MRRIFSLPENLLPSQEAVELNEKKKQLYIGHNYISTVSLNVPSTKAY